MGLFGKFGTTSLLIVILGSNPAFSDISNATGVVRDFQTSLVDAMKRAKSLGIQGRFALLKPVIEKRFHLPLMIATAAAPYWKAGTAEQRNKLLSAFRRMSATTLATLFDGYNGETFLIERERKTSGRAVIVDTQILRKKDDPVKISYVVVAQNDRWWIIDIIVSGGISEVKVRRNEYSTFLKKGGLDNLAAALEATADRLLSGKAKVFAQ